MLSLFRSLNRYVIRSANERLSIRFQSTALDAMNELSGTDSPKSSKLERGKPKASKSFVMNMYMGEIAPDYIFPYPNTLNSDEKETVQMLIDPVTKFFKEVNNAQKNDLQERIDREVFQSMAALGGGGLQAPVEYGGAGLNATQMARLGEIVAGNDLAYSVMTGAHQSIGYKAIVLFGSPEQKAKYIPRLAKGEHIAAYCLTEPTNGSDAATVKTRAQLSQDGKHYILNGTKILISNGGIADIFTVFAQTPVADPKTGELKDQVSAFIVERAFGGVKSGPPEKKLGIKASNTAEVYFENCKVPVENLVGGIGNGFKVAMQVLNNGRFGMIAGLSGMMRHLIERSVEQASVRVQFGKKIADYGTIQEKIARMTMRHYVTESMAYLVSGMMDLKVPEYQIEAAIGKVYCSESAWYCVDETLQIFGGMGFIHGTGIERIFRDLRVFRIFEGINEVMRLFIAFTGLQHAGSHLRAMVKQLQNPLKNPDPFLNLLSRRVRVIIGSDNRDELLPHVHPKLHAEAISVSKQIVKFGHVVEQVLIKYGKKIEGEQMVVQRLAEATIELFAQVVAIARCSRALSIGGSNVEHELKLVRLICLEGKNKVTLALAEANSPDRKKQFDLLREISNEISDNKGIIASRPLGF